MKERLQGRLAGGKQTSLDSSSVTYSGGSDCVECCCPDRIVWKSSYECFPVSSVCSRVTRWTLKMMHTVTSSLGASWGAGDLFAVTGISMSCG